MSSKKDPKKAAAGKKGKKVEEKDEENLSVDEQKLYLERQVEALKLALVKESNKSHIAEGVVRELRQKLIDLQRDYEDEKRRTLDLAADMTRQYKVMREELLKKINALEDDIQSYKDKLDAAHAEKEAIIRAKDAQIALKEQEIQEQKNKMDEMAHEFGQMLKQTLDKMSEKIEITNEWESEGKDEPVVRTFEDFNLGNNNNLYR